MCGFFQNKKKNCRRKIKKVNGKPEKIINKRNIKKLKLCHRIVVSFSLNYIYTKFEKNENFQKVKKIAVTFYISKKSKI